ncbi:MAG: hypothetical protein AAF631_11835 [Pseudomonadota bacterium]
MKAHTASLINAATLILVSIWAYVATSGGSLTTFIPALFGMALVVCYPGVRAENKVVAHVAVTLTLVVLIALYMPLSSALTSGEAGPLIRSILMVITTVLAMVFFIKSFRDARRARAGA